jgi:glycosyltransferase involved in cell wall biosynthesis
MGAEDRGHVDLDAVADLHDLGYVDDERIKVLAFSAADAVVHPALQDNLPNVVLESIACGTPVIGFPTGGVPEMVRPDVTGWLARRTDSESLADALASSFSDLAAGVDLRDSCRDVAEREYSADLQAQRYEELFRTMSGAMES